MDDPTPRKEENAIVLDYLKFGYINPNRSISHGKPIAQAIGIRKFTLMELIPKRGIDLDIHEDVYIGSGKRDQIYRVKGLLRFENLTATSRIEMEYTIKEIILNQEEKYIKFFNEIDALNTRMHKLELIPGIGKKQMQMILDERKKEPFKSFEDLTERIPLIKDPAGMLAQRVKLELDTTQVKRGKKKYYLFTQVPNRHPSNKRRYKNKGNYRNNKNNQNRKNNRNRNNKNNKNKINRNNKNNKDNKNKTNENKTLKDN